MQHVSGIEDKARAARNKKAVYGTDVDLESYESEAKPQETVDDAEDLPSAVKKAALDVGVKLDAESSGEFVQMDQTPVVAKSLYEGVEIMDMASALEKYDNLQDYWWKLVAPDADKYTADVAAAPPAGYFIRAKKGMKTVFPVKSCLYLGSTDLNQRVHNVIIAEEGSELHIITGCTTPAHVQRGLHMGVSEFFIEKNAKVSFTMVHSWGKEVEVRPRTGITIAEGGSLSNNYILLKPVKTLQTFPTATLAGRGAVASFNTGDLLHHGKYRRGEQCQPQCAGYQRRVHLPGGLCGRRGHSPWAHDRPGSRSPGSSGVRGPVALG